MSVDRIVGRDDRARSPMRWLVLVAGAIWFGVVSQMALSSTRREFIGIDDASSDLSHLLAFAGLAAVLYTVFGADRPGWQTAIGVLAVCTLFGLAIEVGQLSTGGRTFEVSDLLFDVLGAWFGLLTAAVVARAAGWTTLTAGVLAVLVLSLAVLPFARATDVFDDASIEAPLDCPRRTFEPPVTVASAEPLLDFPMSEGSGTEITDLHGRSELTIGDPDAVDWTSDGLRLHGSAEIVSLEPPVDFVEAVQASDEVSVEAWIEPARLPQRGPVRVVTISRGTSTGDVDVHLGVERRGVSMRVRTDCDLFNWTIAEDVLSAGTLHHVVVTYRPGELAIHVDGEEVARRRTQVGLLDDWDDSFLLHVGDEAGGGRAFRGTIDSIALFGNALDADEVTARFSAGPG